MKAILVTGASTGIGNHLTTHLAEQGHLVYITAHKAADLKALAEITIYQEAQIARTS